MKASLIEGHSTGDNNSYFMTTPQPHQKTTWSPLLLTPQTHPRGSRVPTLTALDSLSLGTEDQDRRRVRPPRQKDKKKIKIKRSVSSCWLLCFASSQVFKRAAGLASLRVSQGRALSDISQFGRVTSPVPTLPLATSPGWGGLWPGSPRHAKKGTKTTGQQFLSHKLGKDHAMQNIQRI